MLNIRTGIRRAARQVAQQPIRIGVATSIAAAMTFGTPAHAEQVRVVETSLGLADNTRLLRHLGLRIGSDDDFVECHFGPSESGQLKEGFLNYGKGKVADSEYLDVIDAGETSLTKDEVIQWCKDWAKDRVFVTVGQNCWTMVFTFLDEHEGCIINDNLKFKEERINQATKALVNAAENLAEEKGTTTEEVMQEVLNDPTRVFPLLFTAENIKDFVPQNMEPVIEKGQEVASNLPEAFKRVIPGSLDADDAAGQVENTAADLNKQADNKKKQKK